jgi:uncharacterized protein
MHKILSFIAFLTISFGAKAQEINAVYFKENYTKKEVYIPMRDGVKLFTAIYTPKDATEKHPILMTRTPYSCAPYGEANYAGYANNYKAAYVKVHICSARCKRQVHERR